MKSVVFDKSNRKKESKIKKKSEEHEKVRKRKLKISSLKRKAPPLTKEKQMSPTKISSRF